MPFKTGDLTPNKLHTKTNKVVSLRDLKDDEEWGTTIGAHPPKNGNLHWFLQYQAALKTRHLRTFVINFSLQGEIKSLSQWYL